MKDVSECIIKFRFLYDVSKLPRRIYSCREYFAARQIACNLINPFVIYLAAQLLHDGVLRKKKRSYGREKPSSITENTKGLPS